MCKMFQLRKLFDVTFFNKNWSYACVQIFEFVCLIYSKRLLSKVYCNALTFSIYIHFNTLTKKNFRKALWKNVKLLKMSNFTFFQNVFYAICILNSFNSHISVVVCSLFEFGRSQNGVLGNGLKKIELVNHVC